MNISINSRSRLQCNLLLLFDKCHAARTNGRRPKELKSMSKHLNIKPCVLSQSLTFILLSYIRFVVFLYVLFNRKKNQKLPAHGLSKSLTPLLGNSTNIPRLSLSCRLCLPFQSREQKNSLHALPASYGTHAQTLLFLFLNWNGHALLLKRCRFSF